MIKYRVYIEGTPTIVWGWSQGSFPEVTFKLRPEG